VTITMLVFVIVAAVAIVLQTGILFAFYKLTRETTARMENIVGRMEQQTTPVLVTAHAILEDAQPKLAEITSNLAESSATVRAHVAQMADATGEIVERARTQAARLDEVVSSTMEKIEITTDFVQHSVIGPVRRIHAIVQAVSAGLGFLKAARARRKAAENHDSGVDEEMFI
jgi:methyl-accepting chemotaxis protein